MLCFEKTLISFDRRVNLNQRFMPHRSETETAISISALPRMPLYLIRLRWIEVHPSSCRVQWNGHSPQFRRRRKATALNPLDHIAITPWFYLSEMELLSKFPQFSRSVDRIWMDLYFASWSPQHSSPSHHSDDAISMHCARVFQRTWYLATSLFAFFHPW